MFLSRLEVIAVGSTGVAGPMLMSSECGEDEMNGDDEAWSADAAMARIDAGVKRSWLATWEEGSDSEGEDEDLIESDGEDADEAEEEADGCRSRSKRRRLVARMLSAVTDAVIRDNFIVGPHKSESYHESYHAAPDSEVTYMIFRLTNALIIMPTRSVCRSQQSLYVTTFEKL